MKRSHILHFINFSLKISLIECYKFSILIYCALAPLLCMIFFDGNKANEAFSGAGLDNTIEPSSFGHVSTNGCLLPRLQVVIAHKCIHKLQQFCGHIEII